MAITLNTRPYELLIRYNVDGKIGAHRQTITEIKDGDTLINETINAPEELGREELQQVVAALTDEDWFVGDDE